MHVYSINSNKRETVITVIVIVDIILSACIGYYKLDDALMNFFLAKILKMREEQYIYALLNASLQALFPITIYGCLYTLYTNILWKFNIFYIWHQVPDFNGSWRGTVKSPLKENDVEITAKIRQTWNKISVMTESHSTAESETAMIQIEDTGKVFFRYSFLTNREGEIPYIGYNKLSYDAGSKRLTGEYFTNKKLKEACDSGKGSKGTIELQKVEA